jgi:hypothetical protein
MLLNEQLKQRLHVWRSIVGQEFSLRIPPMIDDLHETELFDQSFLRPTVAGCLSLTTPMVANRAFADIQLSSDRTIRFAFFTKYLKSHDFIL